MTADMHIQKELKDQVHEKSFKRTVCFGNLKMYVSIAMPTKLIGIYIRADSLGILIRQFENIGHY